MSQFSQQSSKYSSAPFQVGVSRQGKLMTQQKCTTLIGEKQMSTCWTQISMRQ